MRNTCQVSVRSGTSELRGTATHLTDKDRQFRKSACQDVLHVQQCVALCNNLDLLHHLGEDAQSFTDTPVETEVIVDGHSLDVKQSIEIEPTEEGLGAIRQSDGTWELIQRDRAKPPCQT